MKGKMIICSTLVCILVILIPATNAIQVHTAEKNKTSLPSWQEMKTMNAEALQTYLQTLLKDTPTASASGQKWQASEQTGKISDLGLSAQPLPSSPTAQNNQTLLEKIYWKVFNYRLFRFYISACIYVYHPTKLTLMRMTTWGIKLLRFIQIGIILGYLPATPQPPTQPTIIFMQDLANKTLTVTAVTPDTLLWSDIDQIGSGHCDPLPNENVTVGDTLTNCTGIIVLRYIPLNSILGVFEFT